MKTKFSVGAIVGVIALVGVLIAGLAFYGVVNSARSGAVTKEVALVAQYEDNKAELSKFILQFKESLGIADRQTDKLDEILTNAVKGRYDNDGSLLPGTGGSMFSAIAEAYPDLTATTESYITVQNLVISGREAYKNAQSKLLDMIREYKTYVEADLFRKWVLTTFVGVPTDNLTVTDVVNGSPVSFSGDEALDRISRVVLVQDAVDAYDTGVQGPLITPDEE